MVSYDPPFGFALRRNGSCLSSEVSCGHTWGDFYACCPYGSVCPGSYEAIEHNVCCPSKANCTAALNDPPHCANSSWTLFDHDYFCCLSGQTAFWTDNPDNAVGCTYGVPSELGETILNPISNTITTASASTSLMSTASTVPFSNSASVSDSTAGSSSSNHTGAIAGGVVGGVAGMALIISLLWCLLRRRRRPPLQTPVGVTNMVNHRHHNNRPVFVGELDTRGVVSELGDQPVHELSVGK